MAGEIFTACGGAQLILQWDCGENIQPAEVEHAIDGHPDVSELAVTAGGEGQTALPAIARSFIISFCIVSTRCGDTRTAAPYNHDG